MYAFHGRMNNNTLYKCSFYRKIREKITADQYVVMNRNDGVSGGENTIS